VLVLEFTIEPFVAGQPGPHVIQAVQAAERLGVEVDFGPFGTTCRVDDATVGPLSSAVLAAAFAHGATHVSLHVERVES
jgi:uncharacterized protein YqgV (UPF0045/DUF77 family)